MERYYAAPYTGTGFGTIAFVKSHAALSRTHAFVWSHVSGGDGANCDMRSHGGWADAAATLGSVEFLIRNGFDHAG